jgi:hypothetical protein
VNNSPQIRMTAIPYAAVSSNMAFEGHAQSGEPLTFTLAVVQQHALT